MTFDGTIVEHKFPEIGPPLPHSLEVIKELITAGHKIILWTCREDKKKRQYLTEAVEFLKQQGIELRSINENLPEDDFRDPYEYPKRRKIYAHVYIDDAAFGAKINWLKIKKQILGDIK